MVRYPDLIPGFRSRSIWRALFAVLLNVWSAVLIVRGAANGYSGVVVLGCASVREGS